MTDADANRLFQAFADPLRLRILNLLVGGPLCVGDLVVLLAVPQPTASRHLGRLRRAGLVTTRKRGPWVIYALAEPTSGLAARLIDCLDCCLQEVPALADDQARAAELRRAGGCCPAVADELAGERPVCATAERRSC
jgi:ArsR family transcriptional regulator